jgi:hypothetical protein
MRCRLRSMLRAFTRAEVGQNSTRILELFIPTNALRQFFHCFLYYKDAQIRISAVIPPSSGGILSEFFLHRPILVTS